MQEILNIIAEIEGWNQQDRNRFKDGAVDFDGTFVFVARQKKIARLKELVAEEKRKKA